MKGSKRVATPQLAGGDSTLDEVSTVIIQDTFILALFSIVMLGTALISITTHNGFLSSEPGDSFYQEPTPSYSLAMLERQQIAAGPCGENSLRFGGSVRPDLRGEPVRRGLIDHDSIFTLQRSFSTRFSPRVGAAQPNSGEKAGGDVGEEKIVDRAPVVQEQAVPYAPEQAASGGSDLWNGTGDLYDGYAISTIINNP
jgi:hypothetical protein